MRHVSLTEIRVLSSDRAVDEILSVTIQNRAIEQYLIVVQFFFSTFSKIFLSYYMEMNFKTTYNGDARLAKGSVFFLQLFAA